MFSTVGAIGVSPSSPNPTLCAAATATATATIPPHQPPLPPHRRLPRSSSLTLVAAMAGEAASSSPSPAPPSSPPPAAASIRRRKTRRASIGQLLILRVLVSNVKSLQVAKVERAADWRAARTYKESGVIFEGKVEGSNNGGLLLRFYSLLGFLPYPLLSPSHSCRDPLRTIQETAKDLVGSSIAVKVIEANEEEKKLIFSEKDASWSKYSSQVKIGDVFDAVVGSVEDYGAFAHLRFPDGRYHLTGLVHVSEVSWDLVQDVRDFLNEGDQVKVKVINIDREKSRITLSIKQLEDDPLLETLEKVIPQEDQQMPTAQSLSSSTIEPLPGLESICNELLQEEGITDVQLGRQGLEKRVVSQDLELWLSNVPAKDKQFTLLARAGRQVQEVYLTTTLNQDGIKKAVQRVLGRVP
uniref:S1 motif domain-containing protein n=1 Tax=Ananas comosus var. bracteatus TaxID=296719 RepID=A0A6V7QST5_ANACO